MPYYGAGDYYQGDYYQGDNYAAGGFLGSIGKFVGGVARKLVARTPVGMALSLVPGISSPIRPMIPDPSMLPKPGFKGALQRALPGGESGYYRRRRINVTNVKALRRAGRRVRGFLKLAGRLGALPISARGKKLFKARRRK